MTETQRQDINEMVELGVSREAATKMTTNFCDVPSIMAADGWEKVGKRAGRYCHIEGHETTDTLVWEKDGKQVMTVGTCCGCQPPCCVEDEDED
jgi:hypothetical protein